ncbi:uncharacterized protein J8A68_002048 [[Candida] subhashii]|uniref:Uncharacterized protein n=1 Tax=[Candida] subhashii TaxID=561895 RepID=A0A8J5UYM0_9ASCO|nr:uncharacterized protein J8A68_002048 [[Candida] subhashii]KAG7664445.1 hypothetical protein J8A68_002048 [[Candida] subhashii]
MQSHNTYNSDESLIIEPAYYSEGNIPIFKPTMQQFNNNFYQFNKAINKYGMSSGIVKIIPPKEWKYQINKFYTNDNLINNIIIKNPIIQHINQILPGIYQQQNIERQRKYNIYQWKHLSDNYKPPNPKRRHSQSQSQLPDEQSSQSQSQQSAQHEPSSPTRKLRPHHHPIPEYTIDTSEFNNDERCKELESIYWKSLTYSEPMYGADMLGSLFPHNFKSWNIAQLPNILDLMDNKIPGVNDAYLYAGLWKATFAWHLEDQDLYSINYIHFGAPKQWYSIPQHHQQKFFEFMKDTFNEDYLKCHEFLRHKTFLVSPALLRKNGIDVNHIIHREGEFIITYPYGYHAGFNYGYNLAESVNFALDDWFEFGKIASKCECISDSVAININQLMSKYYGTRILNNRGGCS